VSNIIPECIVHSKMSGGHYSLNRVTAYAVFFKPFLGVKMTP